MRKQLVVDIICKECGRKFDKEKSFHGHLRSHNMDVQKYYEVHCPRYDWWDGSLIKFKNKEHYFSENFNSRSNLLSWLTKKATPEEAKIYSIELLKQRKEEKGLIYAPDFVYLKSLFIPSIDYYEKYQGGYNKVAESIGLQPRYNYEAKITVKAVENSGLTIHTDSREQKALSFTSPTVKNTLNFGDYGCNGTYFSNVWVDRKEISDFVSSLSSGYERIIREIERAKEQGAYLIFACERPLKEALAIEYLPFLHTQCTSSFIFHRIRDLLQKYNHLQFCFCSGRQHLSHTIEQIFLMQGTVKTLDLQYYITKGLL